MSFLRRPLVLFILLALPDEVCLAQEKPPPVEVATSQLASEITRKLTLTGTVSSQRQAQLSARTEGLVTSVNVDAGSKVQRGDVLLRLDTRLAEIELDLVRAEIATAEVELEDAERRVEEVSALVASGGFSKTESDARKATVRIRETQLDVLHVRKDQQEERLARHQVIAPFSGYISRKASEAGEWVDTGTTVLELVEINSLWFDLQVAQEHIGAVRDSPNAVIRFDSFPDRTFDAKVDVLVPVKDPVSRTFLTRLIFEDPEGLASPGMSGTATITQSPQDSSAVTVPRDAVVRFPDGSAKVWVVAPGKNGTSTVKSVEVKTSNALGETAEILEGLDGGEKVVVRGNEGLSDGQEVEVRERQPTQGINAL